MGLSVDRRLLRLQNGSIERTITNRGIAIWLSAQRLCEDIAQPPQLLLALRVDTGVASLALELTGHQEVAVLAIAAVVAEEVDQAAAQRLVGLDRVHPCRTRQRKCSHSHQFAKQLRYGQRNNLT